MLGCLTWVTAVSVLGYAAGTAYEQVLASMDRAGQIGLAAVLLLGVVLLLVRRARGPWHAEPSPGPTVDDLRKAA